MKRKIKKKKLPKVLLFLYIASVLLTGTTFAKFKTTKAQSNNARVAKAMEMAIQDVKYDDDISLVDNNNAVYSLSFKLVNTKSEVKFNNNIRLIIDTKGNNQLVTGINLKSTKASLDLVSQKNGNIWTYTTAQALSQDDVGVYEIEIAMNRGSLTENTTINIQSIDVISTQIQ